MPGATATLPSVCTACTVCLHNNNFCVFKAPEKDTEMTSLNTDDLAADDEPTPEGQEDDGDWEQVGPRNKSMVTRMV